MAFTCGGHSGTWEPLEGNIWKGPVWAGQGQKENKREVAGSGGHSKEKANARVCGLFCFCFACLFVVVDFKNKSFLFFVESSFKNGTQ